MATDLSFVHYVAEQAGLGARLGWKKMFGEYALYLDGKVVAFACDDSLFVKPTPAWQALEPGIEGAPPYPGAKDYAHADALLDEPSRLRQLLEATAGHVPVPRPKAGKAARVASGKAAPSAGKVAKTTKATKATKSTSPAKTAKGPKATKAAKTAVTSKSAAPARQPAGAPRPAGSGKKTMPAAPKPSGRGRTRA